MTVLAAIDPYHQVVLGAAYLLTQSPKVLESFLFSFHPLPPHQL